MVDEIVDDFSEIKDFISDYPLTSSKLKLQKPSEISASLINKVNDDDFSKLIKRADKKDSIEISISEQNMLLVTVGKNKK